MPNKLQEMVETAAEFGERFPDEDNTVILEHVAFVLYMDESEILPRSNNADIILCAYDKGEKAAYDLAATIFGVDMRP